MPTLDVLYDHYGSWDENAPREDSQTPVESCEPAKWLLIDERDLLELQIDPPAAPQRQEIC